MELRPRDVDFATRILTVSRVVVELVPRFHPSHQHFLVKQYPKGQEYRRLKLSAQLLAKLKAHINGHGISAKDLLFPMPETTPAALQLVADPETLDWTLPNSSGRRYRHGTLSAYTAGGCRCRNCKNSYALYRAQRRANGRTNLEHSAGLTLTPTDTFLGDGSANMFGYPHSGRPTLTFTSVRTIFGTLMHRGY